MIAAFLSGLSAWSSPVWRWAAGVAFVLAAVTGAYVQGRIDGVAAAENRLLRDSLRRVEDALRAGDRLRLDGERLRDNDGHRRD